MSENFEDFYNKNLEKFGSTAQGVGWKNEAAQQVRFQQLAKVITEQEFSINDLGCGTGDFVNHLNKANWKFEYHGYDIMPEMIERAVKRFNDISNILFHRIESAKDMKLADYSIASGIFNIRFNCEDEKWLDYILNTLVLMNEKSNYGFAFNILTKYSDPEFMKGELFYADPCYFFDYCKKHFSKNVALLHDYDQYDFTIIVRKKL
jgi:SAM-dependent methyltransferase